MTASTPEAPYTPTTAGVRECFSWWGADPGPHLTADEQALAFDRWLAAHDAEVKAEGKREGWDEGFEVAVNKARALASMTPNPYRTETPNV